MLRNLMEDLVGVEESELSECETRLHSLEQEVLNMEKKEFSLMKVFDIEYNEKAHSSFLAWLLDPQADHDLSDRFVKKFIFQAASKVKELNLSNIDFRNLRIDREIPGDESRLDIRIRDPSDSFLCVIENKIFSGEGVDQTNRLYRDFHNRAVNELFVFLSLNENVKPKNSNFIHMTYREILSIVKSLLKETMNLDAKYLISHIFLPLTISLFFNKILYESHLSTELSPKVISRVFSYKFLTMKNLKYVLLSINTYAQN